MLPNQLYRPSLALLTDLYELTMALGFWKTDRADHEAVFHLFFREPPFGGGYTVAAGLAPALDWLSHFQFSDDDLSYLATLTGNDDRALFPDEFLRYLADLRLTVDLHAMPEGTVAFPFEPIVRVRGPLLQCQLLESALLNIINFQSLIATKAARICEAAHGPVLEFGLRRAQGLDGALAVTRAAYIGGCDATSNVLGAHLYNVPPKGTHAHSWVMAFDSEQEAFDAYAAALPNNCIFLVDTYDTLTGVQAAINTARQLREQGHTVVGIRLDSGDLAYLSIKARELLDQAGFPAAKIVASSDLDEHVITSLQAQGARIDVWGVGTRLVTAHDDPALGGVYKLAALRPPGAEWQHKLKLSEQLAKNSIPGLQQVRRYSEGDEFVGDMIRDELLPVADPPRIVDPSDSTRRKRFKPTATYEDLLVPVVRGGAVIYTAPTLEQVRARCRQQLAGFHGGIKRLINPHQYPAGLELNLHEKRHDLIVAHREQAP